jgi:hypothetical protein
VLEASLKRKTNGPAKAAKRTGAEPAPLKKKKAKS